MNDFETIGKRLPYAESKDYVEQLVEKTTEQAIGRESHVKAKVRPLHLWMAAAAVALLLVVVGVTQYRVAEGAQQDLVAQKADSFNDSLEESGDDELLLAYNNLSPEDQEFLMEVYEQDFFINDIIETNEEEQ